MTGQECKNLSPEVHEGDHDGGLKRCVEAADQADMRRLLPLALLALSGLPFASASGDDVADSTHADVVHTEGVRVGMSRAEFAPAMERRHPTIISEVGGILAIESADPAVEFERYEFTQQTPDQPARLWRITLAYRAPADRARFDAVEDDLVAQWGSPAESVSRGAEHGEPPYERRVWRAGVVSVTLAGYPDGETTGDVARLQVVTVDRRLEGVAMAERKRAAASKK
jgi:hypothetical protein